MWISSFVVAATAPGNPRKKKNLESFFLVLLHLFKRHLLIAIASLVATWQKKNKKTKKQIAAINKIIFCVTCHVFSALFLISIHFVQNSFSKNHASLLPYQLIIDSEGTMSVFASTISTIINCPGTSSSSKPPSVIKSSK